MTFQPERGIGDNSGDMPLDQTPDRLSGDPGPDTSWKFDLAAFYVDEDAIVSPTSVAKFEHAIREQGDKRTRLFAIDQAQWRWRKVLTGNEFKLYDVICDFSKISMDRKEPRAALLSIARMGHLCGISDAPTLSGLVSRLEAKGAIVSLRWMVQRKPRGYFSPTVVAADRVGHTSREAIEASKLAETERRQRDADRKRRQREKAVPGEIPGTEQKDVPGENHGTSQEKVVGQASMSQANSAGCPAENSHLVSSLGSTEEKYSTDECSDEASSQNESDFARVPSPSVDCSEEPAEAALEEGEVLAYVPVKFHDPEWDDLPQERAASAIQNDRLPIDEPSPVLGVRLPAATREAILNPKVARQASTLKEAISDVMRKGFSGEAIRNALLKAEGRSGSETDKGLLANATVFILNIPKFAAEDAAREIEAKRRKDDPMKMVPTQSGGWTRQGLLMRPEDMPGLENIKPLTPIRDYETAPTVRPDIDLSALRVDVPQTIRDAGRHTTCGIAAQNLIDAIDAALSRGVKRLQIEMALRKSIAAATQQFGATPSAAQLLGKAARFVEHAHDEKISSRDPMKSVKTASGAWIRQGLLLTEDDLPDFSQIEPL